MKAEKKVETNVEGMAGWLERLKKLNPCIEGFKHVSGFDDPQTWWDSSEQPDWMLWLIGRTEEGKDRKKVVGIACVCVRLALPYTKDPQVLKCIETTEAWVKGGIDIEQVRQERRKLKFSYAFAAYAADDDAYADDDADAATYAAYAATYAAYAATYAAYAAAYAADATYAADAAADAAYTAYAYAPLQKKEVLRQCCNMIRTVFPVVPSIK